MAEVLDERSFQREEMLRCGRDPAYFINTYVRIQHPVRGLIPFRMFDYQEELVSDYVKNRFNIILKSRQIGISELTAAYAAWMLLFHRNKNVLVMATKADTAKNIVKKIRVALSKIPEWLMLAKVISDNKMSVELDNGSQIKAIASADDAGRSEALSLLIIDEAAFVKNLDELWVGLKPTVSAGGSIIVLSTPNGVGNKFHSLWTESEKGENDFKRTKLMWWVHPERIEGIKDNEERPSPHPEFKYFKTSPWYENEVKSSNMSDREVAQELECNFNASGDTFLNTEQIDWIKNTSLTPSVKEHWDYNLFKWFRPQAGARYLITADVARGDGRDYSGAAVYDANTMIQQAEYYGKIPVEEFANLLVKLGNEYNKAPLVVENNNVGLACIEHIRLLGYDNLYYTGKGDKPGTTFHSAWGPTDSNEYVPGFTTTAKVRPLIFSKLEEFCRNKSFHPQSLRLYDEAKTFIWEGGKPQAMKGCNDDLMVTHALACWIKDTYISPGEAAAKLDEVLINNMRVFSHDNTELPGASKQPEHVRQQHAMITTTENRVPARLRMPGGKSIDLSWMYK